MYGSSTCPGKGETRSLPWQEGLQGEVGPKTLLCARALNARRFRNVKEKTLPDPGWLSTQIRPP